MRALPLWFPVLFLALTGCYSDPYRNPDDWSATGAVQKNIAMQAAWPSDLIAGRAAHYSNGVAAAAAVDKALGGAAGTAKGLQTAPVTSGALDISGGG